jgi:anti-sigma28 factor (negative regulator of flagellin synthesis)
MSIQGIHGNPAQLPGIDQLQRHVAERGSTTGRSQYQAGKSEDSIFISGRSQEFARVRRLVEQQPDVRLDKVNRLAREIDRETYQVSGKKVADAVIRKHLVDFHA